MAKAIVQYLEDNVLLALNTCYATKEGCLEAEDYNTSILYDAVYHAQANPV